VASEKEEKTLETLLTLPINRTIILAGKLTGSILVAIVGAIAYLIGFSFYLNSFTGSFYMNSFTGIIPTEAGVDLASIGLAPTFLSYVILGISLFMALLSALALAISISVCPSPSGSTLYAVRFSNDVHPIHRHHNIAIPVIDHTACHTLHSSIAGSQRVFHRKLPCGNRRNRLHGNLYSCGSLHSI